MNLQSKTFASEITRQPSVPLHRDKAAIFILSNDGMILEANQKGSQLLGYSPDQSHSGKHHISSVIPKLAAVELIEKTEGRVNPYLRFLSRIGHKFEVNTGKGMQAVCELYFNDIKNIGQHQVLVMLYSTQPNRAE
ncbi:PAS domain-containing protein [Nitrosomonas marina]|uniref:PAS domain-containing protein n=1 Tax=Nitrosomonas marina TaxID=917 RepID=A0A1H8BDR3_9PROT|nr:PAS domain-containing protein [Nitrosomonas marina]SEM80963.1 hypothetical protein SAMN05216325_102224 [Nitrosomonas marina]